MRRRASAFHLAGSLAWWRAPALVQGAHAGSVEAVIVTSTTLWGAVIGGGVGLSHREQWTRVRLP